MAQTDQRQLAATAEPAVHHTSHTVDVQAPPEAVYAIVSDVAQWPLRFAPNVHVEHLERTATTERIQIWATANGEVRTWISRRELDPAARRVTFRQEVSSPPVAYMQGEWIITPAADGTSHLELTHDFRAVDDDPAGVEWITRATDRNSAAELDAVRALAEQYARLGELELTFEDTVRVDGSADDVFDFLYQAQEWPSRLPHVDRLELQEDTTGIQVMSMDTRTADGSVHTTRSIRVALGRERILYKQTETPALMTAHTGEWSLAADGDGVLVTSRHSVTIRAEAVAKVLGERATVADARAFVQKALSTNSTTTLRHAKAYAEARRG
ncbi:aromatase/cyclase [Streptomyces sp. NPDC085866]|uniref:aromatase/cyclase n=1 Tax=Streptomyces sp. NPDC085866 TaxID=3365736 RepID=UPI0037D70F3E